MEQGYWMSFWIVGADNTRLPPCTFLPFLFSRDSHVVFPLWERNATRTRTTLSLPRYRPPIHNLAESILNGGVYHVASYRRVSRIKVELPYFLCMRDGVTHRHADRRRHELESGMARTVRILDIASLARERISRF